MHYVKSQFGHPRGLLGRLVGWIMARTHGPRNDWTVALLEVRPGDRVLEVGFGPGLAIERVAEVARQGFVAGIDRSQTMVRQATGRNASAIREGRVELKQGGVTRLPYENESFDKAFTVNSLHHWADPMAGLAELWRVLKPGGLIAITEQPHGAKGEVQVRAAAREVEAQLAAIGFRDVRSKFDLTRSKTGVCVLGIK